MKCEDCPYHKVEIYEDRDEYCDIFGEFPEDEKSRKDGEGCIFNMRTLDKYKRQNDESFQFFLRMSQLHPLSYQGQRLFCLIDQLGSLIDRLHIQFGPCHV